MHVVIIMAAALLLGFGCLVGGTYLLSGAGWALLACGALLVVLSIVLARGLKKGLKDGD